MRMNNQKILVSACLCGIKCKYNGGSNLREDIASLFEQGKALPVCPEQLGRLPVPRVPCEIECGFSGSDVLDGRARVLSRDGADVTEQFIKGAEQTLKFAKAIGASKAVLKQGSPSCGCGSIYDGTFSGVRKEGDGVAAALLKRAGLKVEGKE